MRFVLFKINLGNIGRSYIFVCINISNMTLGIFLARNTFFPKKPKVCCRFIANNRSYSQAKNILNFKRKNGT